MQKIEYDAFDITALLFLGAVAGFICAGFFFKMASNAAEFWAAVGAVSTAAIPLVIFLISKIDRKKIQQEALKERDLKILKEFIDTEMLPLVKECQKESPQDNIKKDRIRAFAQLWSKLVNLAHDPYYETQVVNLNLGVYEIFCLYNKYCLDNGNTNTSHLIFHLQQVIQLTEDVCSIIRSKKVYEYKYHMLKEYIKIFNPQ